MKTLYILRHATAAAAGGDVDFDRTLVPKGRQEAESQGRRFAQWGWPLHRIVASPAPRAQETAELFAEGHGGAVAVEAQEALYNASGEQLLEAIQGFADNDGAILLVAHMPGVGELLSLLTTEHVDLALAYPAATLSAVQLDADEWADVDYGVGQLALCLPPLPV